jgi:hypothetical protein
MQALERPSEAEVAEMVQRILIRWRFQEAVAALPGNSLALAEVLIELFGDSNRQR